MVTIRPGTAADHADALDIYSRARHTAPSPERLTQVADKLTRELLVVAEQDSVNAFAVAEPLRADDGAGAVIPGALHVSMFFVDPDHQRRGVGRTLLEGLADLAWGQGFRTLSVWSSTAEFYEACGLERTGETTTLSDGRTAFRFSAELEAPTREVELSGDVIRLGQLLKYAGLVDTGAEAKSLLATQGVTVNGEVETRRGRQLHDGDEVRTEQDAVTVRLQAAG